MTLHGKEAEVGVRELHDRLSEYLEKVEQGTEFVVTRRGKPIARLTRVGGKTPLEELAEQGLVRLPKKPRTLPKPIKSKGPVSDFVAEQRR